MTAPVAPPVAPPPSPTPPPAPGPRPDRGPLVQRVLLGAGALCVLVAGGVYLAVSWERIGTTGQAGFAVLVTVLAAVVAHLVTRRDLRASGETLAVVAAGLLALDLAGAHHLDVLGAARLEWWAWLTLATGVVAAVTGALAVVSRLVAYRLVAVTALTVLPYTALVAADVAGLTVSAATGSAVALVVAAGLLALAVVVGRRDALTGLLAALGGAAWWAVAALAGTAAVFDGSRLEAVATGSLWAVLGVVLLLLAGRALAAGRTGDSRIVVSVAAPLAAAPAALVVAGALSGLGPVAVLVGVTLLAAVTALPWAATPAARPLTLAVLPTSAVLALTVAGRGLGFDLLGAVVVATALAAAGAAWRTSGALRVAAVATAVGTGVVGLGLLAVERAEPGFWVTGSWTAFAVALLAAATYRRSEALLAAGGVVIALAGLAGFATQLLDTRSPAMVVALLGAGAAAGLHGVVRVSRTGVLLGAAALGAAALDLAAIARVDALEAYTLPIAAVALVAGVLARVTRPELSSWAWTGAALLVAAVPSAVVALTDPGLARLVLVAAAAALVVVAGLVFRLAAPLLIGAATEAALAVSQLAPYAVGAPRWVTLALAGVLLLTLGVLFERARRSAAVAGRWFASLG